jgi:hypothetical protein
MEINADESYKAYVAVSSQNCRQNHDMKRANRSFENVTQLKYLGTILSNQNLNHEGVKRTLKSRNAC